MVASVPELTRRTCSTGARATISSASSTSPGVAVPFEVPCVTADEDRLDDRGSACPRIIGPQERTRSTYSRTVHVGQVGPDPAAHEPGRSADRAERPDRGVRPAGVTRHARANSFSLASVTLGLAGVDQVLQQPQRVGQRMLRGERSQRADRPTA